MNKDFIISIAGNIGQLVRNKIFLTKLLFELQTFVLKRTFNYLASSC